VQLYRELVTGDRDAHLPDLTRSLTVADRVLICNDRLAEALKPLAEAFMLDQDLPCHLATVGSFLPWSPAHGHQRPQAAGRPAAGTSNPARPPSPR
jgi:hypothetical protein